ncbi:DKNYY domain-containing protein [Flavobacterium pectinovorum]|nr:DKNYY domain-containing protein [Flavobacterium pectinovorum]
MNKYLLFVLLLILKSNLSLAQNPAFVSIKDPIIDTTLVLYPDLPLNRPFYIINKNYVVYQKDINVRNILKVDLETFKIPRNFYNTLFALDKNGIYFDGDFIATDTTGFKFVAEIRSPDNNRRRQMLWKTNQKLFMDATEIKEGIDVKSFKSAGYSNENYFKDKNYVYYKFKKIEGSDVASVSNSFDEIIYDKNYVYIEGKIGMYNGDTIHSVNDYLVKTSKNVLNFHTQMVVQGMDVTTIHGLSRYYAMDKNFVYFRDQKTPILPKNFKNVKIWDKGNIAYITDGIHVYIGSNLLQPEFDAKTFGVISNSEYTFDKNGIYELQWTEKEHKSINKKFPFLYTKKVSDLNSFQGRNSKYLVYENQAYDVLEKQLYKNLTPEQIDLAKKNKLDIKMINNKIFETKTFEYQFYEVNNKIYLNGKETTADAQTFEPVGEYYRDKNTAYTRNISGLVPVSGLDVKTLHRSNYFLADKDYIYCRNYRIIKNTDVEFLAYYMGRRQGCSLDKTPTSDFYLLKNSEGYWLVLISDEVRINFLGNKSIEGLGNITPLYKIPVESKISIDKSKIYNSLEVDVKPEFPGGLKKQIKFINKNFKPIEDEGEKLKGRVYMSFIVEKDGTLTDIRVQRHYGYGSDQEALRVVKKMPKWIPAKYKGLPVRYANYFVITRDQ